MESDIISNHIIPVINLDGQEDLSKFKAFVDDFESTFKSKPEYIICAPGRVNLIGDHIDYHGFSVMPMAIENSVWFGFNSINGSGESAIKIRNQNSIEYPSWTGAHSMEYGSKLDKAHKWHHYVLCGYHGILTQDLSGKSGDRLLEQASKISTDRTLSSDYNHKLKDLKNFNVLVGGNLPAASGLSSSSALVCASSVASTIVLHKSSPRGRPVSGAETTELPINGQELAKSCASFEHLIGTRGGGMDQAVILTAQAGYAKHVEFMPQLRCHSVKLPENIVWLISHCGVDYPKASTHGFNSRVLETKIGAAMICQALGCNKIKLDRSITLGIVKDTLFSEWKASDIVKELREKVFEKDVFTIDDVCNRLKMSRNELIEKFQTCDEFLRGNLNDKVKLLPRCEHVYEEADRVKRFVSICNTTKDSIALGAIMTMSYESLRDKYECSHEALDRLVAEAIKAGALGSRLTGAGWGGCIVSLVDSEKSDHVLRHLKTVSKFTFRSEPQDGCRIFKV